MLSSLIKQLCCRRPDTPEPVQDLERYRVREQRPDIKKLEDTLAATIHGFSKVYLVVDALDECPTNDDERRRLLRSLLRISGAHSNNLHFLCTSRPETDIKAELDPILRLPSSADLDLLLYRDAIDQDISLYIDETLASPTYRSWNESIKNEVKETLIEKAGGM